ncbi:hypothetical protein M3Y99_01048300 [Aphelenchoides fujianensis]|nr:hypothetical protein M3Y99_01048300 [Aphelenchoides fujianensis]
MKKHSAEAIVRVPLFVYEGEVDDLGSIDRELLPAAFTSFNLLDEDETDESDDSETDGAHEWTEREFSVGTAHEWMKREWSEYEDLHKTDDVDICCDIELVKALLCTVPSSAVNRPRWPPSERRSPVADRRAYEVVRLQNACHSALSDLAAHPSVDRLMAVLEWTFDHEEGAQHKERVLRFVHDKLAEWCGRSEWKAFGCKRGDIMYAILECRLTKAL